MEEDEIDAEPIVINAQPALARHECKIIAQLKEKIGKMLDERLFQGGLGVFVLEVEEFEDERVLYSLFRRDCVARLGDFSFLEHRGFVPRKRNALVELAADLPVQLPDGPAGTKGFSLVKRSRLRALDGKQPDVCGPRQRKAACENRTRSAER